MRAGHGCCQFGCAGPPASLSFGVSGARFMTISYFLEGAGWARAVLEHEGQNREMRFSWCSDALSRMIDAATQIAQGAQEARFGFTDEPGEHECVVTRIGPDQVSIRAFWYKEWTPPGPDTGDQVFTCSCPAVDFC